MAGAGRSHSGWKGRKIIKKSSPPTEVELACSNPVQKKKGEKKALFKSVKQVFPCIVPHTALCIRAHWGRQFYLLCKARQWKHIVSVGQKWREVQNISKPCAVLNLWKVNTLEVKRQCFSRKSSLFSQLPEDFSF